MKEILAAVLFCLSAASAYACDTYEVAMKDATQFAEVTAGAQKILAFDKDGHSPIMQTLGTTKTFSFVVLGETVNDSSFLSVHVDSEACSTMGIDINGVTSINLK